MKSPGESALVLTLVSVTRSSPLLVTVIVAPPLLSARVRSLKLRPLSWIESCWPPLVAKSVMVSEPSPAEKMKVSLP